MLEHAEFSTPYGSVSMTNPLGEMRVGLGWRFPILHAPNTKAPGLSVDVGVFSEIGSFASATVDVPGRRVEGPIDRAEWHAFTGGGVGLAFMP
jgi:hypothetical protein